MLWCFLGERQVTALDVVSNTGLINYFGRWTDITQIDVSPILLQKGETKLALFGLSHVKDERLGRLFRNKKVRKYLVCAFFYANDFR